MTTRCVDTPAHTHMHTPTNQPWNLENVSFIFCPLDPPVTQNIQYWCSIFFLTKSKTNIKTLPPWQQRILLYKMDWPFKSAGSAVKRKTRLDSLLVPRGWIWEKNEKLYAHPGGLIKSRLIKKPAPSGIPGMHCSLTHTHTHTTFKPQHCCLVQLCPSFFFMLWQEITVYNVQYLNSNIYD